ncbi:MAG TPA: hypothetical protein VEK38_00810 [Candidatus Bathyarchaeia archaeon]|nr:hypothetical protein [Candidatus Bathyarchaeia archaeon]
MIKNILFFACTISIGTAFYTSTKNTNQQDLEEDWEMIDEPYVRKAAGYTTHKNPYQKQYNKTQTSAYFIEKTKTANPKVTFTFEMKNKGSFPFYLTVIRGDGAVIVRNAFIPQKTNVQPGYLRIEELSTYPSLTLILQFYNSTLTKIEHQYTYDIMSEGSPTFVSWDGSKLVPQTGSYWGYSGYTESGIPLNNNIEQRDIRFEEELHH